MNKLVLRILMGIVLSSTLGLSAAEARIPLLAKKLLMPPNTHLVDVRGNGFEIYRTSKPWNGRQFKRLCKRGISELMVLDGTGADDVALAKQFCPGMKILNVPGQNGIIPVTSEFLRSFDEWVRDAQANGKKIAFRCTCGCHRTGRLTAYYKMEHANVKLSPGEAIVDMNEKGRFMWLFPTLPAQVRAMYSHARGEECRESRENCVSLESAPSTIEVL